MPVWFISSLQLVFICAFVHSFVVLLFLVVVVPLFSIFRYFSRTVENTQNCRLELSNCIRAIHIFVWYFSYCCLVLSGIFPSSSTFHFIYFGFRSVSKRLMKKTTHFLKWNDHFQMKLQIKSLFKCGKIY